MQMYFGKKKVDVHFFIKTHMYHMETLIIALLRSN